MLDWNGAFPPFRVAGNIHYVGTNRMAIFLIATPAGHILLDSGFEVKVPMLVRNVEALGFHFGDVKILIDSHAHIDHVQGHAEVRRLTGARVLASAADAVVIESGGKHEYAYGDQFSWAPCPVDAIVADGEKIELGGTTVTAHLTPGHARGATTWTMTVPDEDAPDPASARRLDVVFYPSGTVAPGARIVNNPEYPKAVADFQQSFVTWRRLPCDIFLGSHSQFFDLAGKWKRLQAGDKPNPFVDHAGYVRTIDEAEAKFRRVVTSQS